MTYHLVTFSIIICLAWGAFLWWTAHPTRKPPIPPRIEERIEPESAKESATYKGDDLNRIMQHRDPFRRN